MDSSIDYGALQQQISSKLIATTRIATQLAAEDLEFLRASDKKAGKRVDRKNGKLLELAQGLMVSSTQGTQIPPPAIKKATQIEENWRSVADIIDNLLERADKCLDEYTGVITKLSKEREQAILDRKNAGRDPRNPRNPRIHPLEKPQLLFKRVPRNDETTPFKPLLTKKPHAVVPLDEVLRHVPAEDGGYEYPHPYQREIEGYSYPKGVYEYREPVPPIDDPEAKTLTWVDTPEKVNSMLEELKEAKEIAVDLEHHDAHSYVGLVSLMQISTREKDWIVDTLKPWREDLQVLNEVFANPNVLKVLHGSTMDMIWLQRDLGIYVVGLFDTYHASHALEYPRHGLAYLLKRFEDFDAQKQYQMADWRIRPLPPELMLYARSDTHYLLHIYDHMRNELVQQSTPKENLVDYVLEKSKAESLQKYERFIYNLDFGFGGNGWLSLLWRTPAQLSNKQFAVFRAVHQFRDQIARLNDESLLAVMRNDTVFSLAREMPDMMSDLLIAVHPITQFVQPKVSDLLSVIRAAKAKGDSGPSMDDVLNGPEVQAYQERMGYGSFKRRYEKKFSKPTTTQNSGPTLAEIQHNEREKAEEAPKVADESTFWGHTLNRANGAGVHNELRLNVPLPGAENQFATSNDTKPSPKKSIKKAKETVTVKTEPVATQEPVEPATFSIKDLKRQTRKRKAEEAVDAVETPVAETKEADEPSTPSPSKKGKKKKKDKQSKQTPSKADDSADADDIVHEEDTIFVTTAQAFDAKQTKKQKKAEKKAAAQAAKEAQMDEAPFDYASAPNITEGAAAKGKQHKKQGALDNYYAKSLDTSKGLPRRATGTAGRSKTFKK